MGRVLVFEIAPAALLVAWGAFVVIAGKAAHDREVQMKLATDSPELRAVYEQPLKDPAAMMKAADALDLSGRSIQALLLLHAAERLMLAEALGENAGLPGTVREALEFEHRNAASRSALRERAFAALAEATIAPRAKDEAEAWISVEGYRHRHFKGSTWWSGDSGSPEARVDLVNRSTRSIRDFVLDVPMRKDIDGTRVIVCRTGHNPPRREPLEWRPKETLRLLCLQGLGIPRGGLPEEVEGLENQRLRVVAQKVKFGAAPFWITGKSGAVIPEEWSRPKPAEPIVYPGQPLACEAAGTCPDRRWLQDAYNSATRYSLVVLSLLSVMTGLVTCAIARRIFRSAAGLRAARRGMFVVGAILVPFVVILAIPDAGGFGMLVTIVMLPLGALAYAGWVAGFSLGAWALRPRPDP